MIIRKLFKFEGAHKVFNCSSDRCKYSNHGHSYTVELFFSSAGLDNGMMIVDFGLMKSSIKEFIDSFDHAYSMWCKMPEDEKIDQKKYSQRWIEMPVSPSAEAYALMFFKVIDEMLELTKFNNGEHMPELVSVRVHETDTGYAEAFREDLDWAEFQTNEIIFSTDAQPAWWSEFIEELVKPVWNRKKIFINPIVEKQV